MFPYGQRLAYWLWALSILGIVGALYWQTLSFGFIWDDIQIATGRVDYHSPARWLEAMRQPLDFSPNYFRPLALSSLLVQLWIWKDNPAPFHLVNVLLHLLNTSLVMTLAARALEKRWYGLLTGALYGIHPALVESVAFISSRYDLTATLFMLIGLWLAERWQGKMRIAGVGVAFLLALLCKEMALTFPAVLLLWQFARDERVSLRTYLGQLLRQEKALYGVLIVALIAYLCLRYAALGYLFTTPPTGAQIDAGTPVQHLLLVGRTLTTLIELTLFPFFNITPVHYSKLPVPLSDGVAWVQLMVALAASAGILWTVKRLPFVGWLLVAWIVSLAPVLNLRPLEFVPGVYTAERFLTFPLVLALAALVGAWRSLIEPTADKRLSWAISIGVVLWGVALLIKTGTVVPNWRDSETFWQWVIRTSPDSAIGYANLADVYNNTGRFAKAMEYATKAVQVEPQNGTGYINRGIARLNLGDFEGALEDFQQAVRFAPENTIGWNNLAMALVVRGDLNEAERIAKERMLGRRPRFMAHQLLGLIYLQRQRPEVAEDEFRKAYAELVRPQGMAPDVELRRLQNASLWIKAANYWMLQGNLSLAEKYLQIAAQRNPDKVAYGTALSRLRILQGRHTEAKRILQELLEEGYNTAEIQNLLRLVKPR